MRRLTRLGLAGTGVIALAVGLTTPAFADYAPSTKDVVGVGSDTVQYAMDFVADGDPFADAGYNALGNANKLANFDATADANARLAYSNAGVGTGQCGPGTGATAGTGNANTTHADQPCILNPTVVLRAGTNPVQRPNGSGDGAKALNASTLIDYSRASSAQAANLTEPGIDSVTIGTDQLAMLTSTTTHAVPLSAAQLKNIYSCTATTWTAVGGTSTATIIPIVPQLGSGTRSSFLTAIGVTTPGSCVVTAEENDPEAIDAQSSPADAIEPMSSGRLDLFKGLLSDGTSNGVGGYFKDPSCKINNATLPCPQVLTPNVALVTTGTPSDAGALFNITRNLYIYFRDSAVTSATKFQPGGSLNWVRTLLYNPCLAGATGCVTIGGTTYGAGGQPFVATAAGQALIKASGINPTYAFTANGP